MKNGNSGIDMNMNEFKNMMRISGMYEPAKHRECVINLYSENHQFLIIRNRTILIFYFPNKAQIEVTHINFGYLRINRSSNLEPNDIDLLQAWCTILFEARENNCSHKFRY